jgi:hypothetical protein
MGEASSTAVEELATTALEAVGTDEVKLMKQFHHTEVVAHGAAVFSKIVQEDPGIFGATVFSRIVQGNPVSFSGLSTNRVPDEEYWAEEEARGRLTRKAEEHREL